MAPNSKKNEDSQLQISVDFRDGVYILSFNGDLSLFTVPSARENLSKITSNHKYNLIFDLAGVGYIDSAGVGFIMAAYKDSMGRGGDIKLARLSPFTERLIKGVLNLDMFLSISETLDEAMAEFKANAAFAIYKWQKVLEQCPNFPDAYLNLARIFLRNGLMTEALLEIEKALSINGNYVEALDVRGQILLKTGRQFEAIENFKRVLDIKPDNLEALTWLAICYDDSNMLDEAIARYKNVIDIYPRYADLHYRLGMAYLKKQDFDRAIESFKKALDINPNYLDAHRALSTTYLKLRDREEAVKHLQSICQISLDTKEISEARDLMVKISKNNYPASYFLGKVI